MNNSGVQSSHVPISKKQRKHPWKVLNDITNISLSLADESESNLPDPESGINEDHDSEDDEMELNDANIDYEGYIVCVFFVCIFVTFLGML